VVFVANLAGSSATSFDISAPGVPSLLVQEGLNGSPSVSGGKISFAGLAPRGFAYVSLN